MLQLSVVLCSKPSWSGACGKGPQRHDRDWNALRREESKHSPTPPLPASFIWLDGYSSRCLRGEVRGAAVRGVFKSPLQQFQTPQTHLPCFWLCLDQVGTRLPSPQQYRHLCFLCSVLFSPCFLPSHFKPLSPLLLFSPCPEKAAVVTYSTSQPCWRLLD